MHCREGWEPAVLWAASAPCREPGALPREEEGAAPVALRVPASLCEPALSQDGARRPDCRGGGTLGHTGTVLAGRVRVPRLREAPGSYTLL